jgi:hypothetical protein
MHKHPTVHELERALRMATIRIECQHDGREFSPREMLFDLSGKASAAERHVRISIWMLFGSFLRLSSVCSLDLTPAASGRLFDGCVYRIAGTHAGTFKKGDKPVFAN